MLWKLTERAMNLKEKKMKRKEKKFKKGRKKIKLIQLMTLNVYFILDSLLLM